MGVSTYVYAGIRSKTQIIEEEWKSKKNWCKEKIATVYHKIRTSIDKTDLPTGSTRYREVTAKYESQNMNFSRPVEISAMQLWNNQIEARIRLRSHLDWTRLNILIINFIVEVQVRWLKRFWKIIERATRRPVFSN